MDKDMLVLYSTVPGYYSFRESTGSWLMTTLVAVLDAYLRPHSLAPAKSTCAGRGDVCPTRSFAGVSQHSAIDSSAPSASTESHSATSAATSANGSVRSPSEEKSVDLLALLTLVQRIVAVEFESHTAPGAEDDLKKQVPQLCSTLVKHLCLPIVT